MDAVDLTDDGSIALVTQDNLAALVDTSNGNTLFSVAGNALKVARQLEEQGFRVNSWVQRAAPAQSTETVVRYHAGELAQAQGVLAALGGAAVLYPDAAVPAGHILLQAGSLLRVTAPAPGPTATAASPGSSPAPPVPTPGSRAITPSVFAPQPYDPTAC